MLHGCVSPLQQHCRQTAVNSIQAAIAHGATSLQVLDLGSTEEVASWDEGEIHYQEITTMPDYNR